MSVPDYQVLDDAYSFPQPDPTWFQDPGLGDPFGSGDTTDIFSEGVANPAANPTMPANTGGSGNFFTPNNINGLLALLSGGVGLQQSHQLQNMASSAIAASNPFGPYRGAAAQQLMSLLADPGSVTKTPGYQFMLDQGIQAVGRGDAARGQNRGGGMDIDLLKYGGEFANTQFLQQEQYLANLAGANITPNPGPGLAAYGAGTSTLSSALAAMGYGVGTMFGAPTAGGASAGTPASGHPSAAGGEAAAGQALAAAGLGTNIAKTVGASVPTEWTGGMQVAGDILGITSGLEHGGVSGDAQAAVGAYNLATGDSIPGVGAALSMYNFAKGWQSGATGNEALSGASTGAAIGTMIAPGVGTLIGTGIGAAAGAVSSAFGPGRNDPENLGWDQYAAQYDKDPSSVQGMSPAGNLQMLAGIFDSRGSSIPFYGEFGRMGETKFLQGMTEQINNAVKSGQISGTASAQDIFNSVVNPWINAMSPGGWQDANTVKGAPTKGAASNLITNLIQNYITGQQGGWKGIKGQQVTGITPYAGIGMAPMQPSQPAVPPTMQHMPINYQNLPSARVH